MYERNLSEPIGLLVEKNVDERTCCERDFIRSRETFGEMTSKGHRRSSETTWFDMTHTILE